MIDADWTVYSRFKGLVSALELAEAFTPTPEEIVWARRGDKRDVER